MKDILREKIILNFKNFKDLETIVNQKQKELEEMKKSTDSRNKIDFYQNFYIDYTLLVSDQRVIFSRLFFLIDLYKELNYEELPKEIVDYYNANKIFSPNEVFVIKNGNLMEKEEGLLEKERKNFLESDFFKDLIKGK